MNKPGERFADGASQWMAFSLPLRTLICNLFEAMLGTELRKQKLSSETIS